MAGSAQSIIGEFNLRGMRIVTVAATNALTEHLALHVGTINVDLVHDLAIIMIGLRPQKFICIIINKLSMYKYNATLRSLVKAAQQRLALFTRYDHVLHPDYGHLR